MTTIGSKLGLEALESREVPAITIVLDYSYDAGGMFNDASRRSVLQQAVNEIAGHMVANLPAIAPGGGNTWAQTFYNPGTGAQTTINNPTVPANTITLYVGGRPIGGAEAGFGGPGGYSASGNQAWFNSLAARGPGGSLLWGGSITFDTRTNWYFGTSLTGIASNQVDFYSVASHELGHVLGIGTSPVWFQKSSGGYFRGVNASTVYNGPVPLSPDGAHWADGIRPLGQDAALDPTIQMGHRVTMSTLDYAGLADLGWGYAATSPPPVVPPPPPPPVAPVPVGSALLNMVNGSTRLVSLTGPTDGSAQIFTQAADGTLTPAGPRFFPFYGFTGVVRSTIADFNGDRIADFAFATGSGVGGAVRIISGATGTDLVGPTTVLGGFQGGVFLAAGDVDRDGRAELAVSADVGGGPRVSVLKVQNGTLVLTADFIAFESPDFRGGSRVAMADVNKDGAADLIVGAGIGGSPRVSIYDGTSLLGTQNRLVPDFFALDSRLRSGVYVTSADLDGDGYSDVLYSTGNTGGPRVRVVSGYLLITNPGADVATLPAMADFFALDANDRAGIRLAARDLNGDGKAELLVASGAKDLPSIRVIPLGQMDFPSNPLQNPFGDPTTIDGIYVG